MIIASKAANWNNGSAIKTTVRDDHIPSYRFLRQKLGSSANTHDRDIRVAIFQDWSHMAALALLKPVRRLYMEGFGLGVVPPTAVSALQASSHYLHGIRYGSDPNYFAFKTRAEND